MQAPQIVIPFYEGAKWLNRLLSTLPPAWDVLVVDDQSPQPVPNVERAGVEVIRNPRRGYWAGACNYGALQRPGRDLLFLNQDIHFSGDGWIDELSRIVDGGVAITGNWVEGHFAWPKGYVDGVFMYARRDAWDAVNGLNEHLYPMWGSSCLLQSRMCRAGYTAAPLPKLRDNWLVHHRQGNLGEAFRGLLAREVGHLGNDGNIFRRVPPVAVVVIVAHGDYHEYLPEAVESVFNQTRPDWQMVIALDGTASPELREQAADYADDWKGIKYVQLPDGQHGPPAVRNTGVKAATTRWNILMLDGDDYAEPQALELMQYTAEQHPGHFVYGDLRWIGDRAGIRRFPEYDYPKLLEHNYIPSFILYPKAAWKAVGGYPTFMSPGWDDYGFNIALGRAGWCGVHVRDVVFNYRRHVHSRNKESQKKRPELRALLREHFPEVFARRFPMGCCGQTGTGNPGSASKKATPKRTPPPKGLGREGMIEIRYIGNLGASFPMRGPVTGKKYKAKRGWRGWVDARDAVALIGTQSNPGISREFDYTGRVNPIVAPEVVATVQAGVRPAVKPKAVLRPDTVIHGKAIPSSLTEVMSRQPTVEAAAAEDAAETREPGYYCQYCRKGPYKTERGRDMHEERFCKERPE